MRILIIEDHVDTAEMMGRLLRRRGHETHAALSVADARAAIEAALDPFDLVLSDVLLPDGSGFDLMPQFRAAGVKHAIAVSGTPEDADRARSAGFHAHLTKPVQLQELLDLIEPLCNRNGGDRPAGRQ